MKYLILWLSILTISFSVFAVPKNQINYEDNFSVRIAVVDIQSILEGSIAIKNLRKTINQLNLKVQQDIMRKEAEFKPLEEELIKNRQLLNEADFEKEVNEFNAKVSVAKKEIQARKSKLEQIHAEAMGKIHELIIAIIADLAKKYDLNLVIPNTQILYAKNNLNLTSEVTFILNEKLKEVTVNY